MQQNFTWFLTAIIYITVVLTAMQVGLGTAQLREDARFNRASYGFTVFAILEPLVLGLIVAVVLLVLVYFNVGYTLSKRTSTRANYPHLFESGAVTS